MNLASKTNYLANYKYLKNVEIQEWDIHHAGWSVLKFRHCLPETELNELLSLPKMQRTIREGLLQREHPEIAVIINETLAEVRTAFVADNNVEEERILSIKKDALFLVNTTIKKPIVFDDFEFRRKHSYTSYVNLNKKEFYYDGLFNTLDTKGFDKEIIKKNPMFLEEIKTLLRSSEKLTKEQLYKFLVKERSKYLNLKLPLEMYRELDTGAFRIGNYNLEVINETMKENLDISQNYLSYFRPLIEELL